MKKPMAKPKKKKTKKRVATKGIPKPGTSWVSRQLAKNPKLAARAEALRQSILQPDEDMIAMERSTRLTGADYATRINCRADDDL